MSLLSVPSATDLAVFSSWKYRVLVFSSCPVILLWTSVCPYWPNHQVSRVGYFRNFNLYIEEKKKGWSTSQGILTTETASCQVPPSLSSWSVNVTHMVRNSTERMVQSSLEVATDTGAFTRRGQRQRGMSYTKGERQWDHRWRDSTDGPSSQGVLTAIRSPPRQETGSPWPCWSHFPPVRLSFQPPHREWLHSAVFGHQTVVSHKQLKQ